MLAVGIEKMSEGSAGEQKGVLNWGCISLCAAWIKLNLHGPFV